MAATISYRCPFHGVISEIVADTRDFIDDDGTLLNSDVIAATRCLIFYTGKYDAACGPCRRHAEELASEFWKLSH